MQQYFSSSASSSSSSSASNRPYLYQVTLVSAIPFYGFHLNPHPFLKLFFYEPRALRVAASLLHAGVVTDHSLRETTLEAAGGSSGGIFQPYEAHLPFILHFMTDFNLHGMNFVDVSLEEAFFRRPLPVRPPSKSPEHFLFQHSIFAPPPASSLPALISNATASRSMFPPHRNLFASSDDLDPLFLDSPLSLSRSFHILPRFIPRQSSCELEVDVSAQAILNRLFIPQSEKIWSCMTPQKQSSHNNFAGQLTQIDRNLQQHKKNLLPTSVLTLVQSLASV